MGDKSTYELNKILENAKTELCGESVTQRLSQ